MGNSVTTRASLLIRIRDARDQTSWSQFVDIYAPLIYGFARRHGLQDADAADLTQEVLRAVARSARDFDYDPQRGSFRGWLFTVVRNKLRDFLESQQRQPRASGNSSEQNLLDAIPSSESDRSNLWDIEHKRRLFNWAAEQARHEVRESTWLAFWQTAVEGKSGKDVAAMMGVSVAAVYLAKSRVMARIKEILREIEPDEPELRTGNRE